MFLLEIYGQIIVNSIIRGSIYAIIAYGFTLAYGTMDFFNMAYGANIMLGAYVFYTLYILQGLPIIISGILSLIIIAMLLIIIDRISYYPLRIKKAPKWALVVMSMSVNLIIVSVVSIVYGNSQHFVLGGATSVGKVTISKINITSIQILIVAFALIIALAVTVFLRKSRVGLLIRALANNKYMASVVGINVEKIFIVIIALSSVLSTTAAIFLALESDIKPMMGAGALLKAIIASIVGKVGNIRGAFFAGYLLGLIENIIVFVLGTGWSDAIALPIVIVLLLLLPSYFGITESN